MGYHKSQEKTLESFEDDWFRSGDLGKIDQDGFLWLTGRLKELLITSGGENIAPVPIENNILAELPRVLSTVVVIGKFLSQFIYFFGRFLLTICIFFRGQKKIFDLSFGFKMSG